MRDFFSPKSIGNTKSSVKDMHFMKACYAPGSYFRSGNTSKDKRKMDRALKPPKNWTALVSSVIFIIVPLLYLLPVLIVYFYDDIFS